MKLEELKALVDAATPGPWDVVTEGTDDGFFQYATGPWHNQTMGDTDLAVKDACLIAAARNHIDRLIAVAEAAKSHLCPIDSYMVMDCAICKALEVMEAEDTP